ncbi:hypothetical protein F4810DRAFT_174 [Camillea tinctor]|nr:hypothetical protein F4810DRAFT_174 [Camillea tinctor]
MYRGQLVRCDGTLDGCNNCVRLQFVCSFTVSATSPPQERTIFEPTRRRGQRACLECRFQKARCSGEEPQCGCCCRRGKICIYLGSKRLSQVIDTRTSPSENPLADNGGILSQAEPSHAGPLMTSDEKTSPSPSSRIGDESSSTTGVPPAMELLSLVQLFFEQIYPLISYSFLHEASVTEQCANGSLDPLLAYGICSVTSMRRNIYNYYPYQTDRWIQQVENEIWQSIEYPTIARLQTLVLVIQYRVWTGRFQRAFMLSSIAARSASALRLNYERTDLDNVAQEIRRRLMWTLMVMDSFFAVGLPEFELNSYENIYLVLPSSEDRFNSYSAGTDQSQIINSPVSQNGDAGLLSFCLRLSTMRRDVMRLKRQVCHAEAPLPQLVRLVEDFRKCLLEIRAETPGSRLYAFGDTGKAYQARWRPRYLMAHLSWHQCNCDLYRLFMRGYKEAAPDVVLDAVDANFVATAASTCLEHATSIIQIILDFNSRSPDTEIVDHDVAICAYQGARIALFAASPRSQAPLSNREAAASQATMCLSFLRRFFAGSAIVGYMISDLEKLIRIHSEGEDISETAQSSDSDEPGPFQAARLSRVARDAQRLGVHSIARQAHFVDDSPGTANVPPRRAYSNFFPQGSQQGSTPQSISTQTSVQSPEGVPEALVSPIPSTDPSQPGISGKDTIYTAGDWTQNTVFGILEPPRDALEGQNFEYGFDLWNSLQ